MIKIPPSIEIPSKIKNIYIELNSYQYNHSSSAIQHFVGRESARNRLKNLLVHTKSSSGAYLVTGYRGMGKTALVEKVFEDIKNLNKDKNKDPKEQRTNYIKIDISLSQDDIKDLDVLKFIAGQLFREWLKLVNPKNFSIREPSESENAEYRSSNITTLLTDVCSNLNSIVKIVKNDQYDIENKDPNSPINKERKDRNREEVRSQSLPKEVEKELIYILDLIDQLRNYQDNPNKAIPYFLFVFDEIDKIEPNYFYDLDNNIRDIAVQKDLDNLFGVNKVRRRQEVVARLLANLKGFLNSAKAKFIFIGGREMYDAALADIADRESFYSSIFHDVIYVNSFLKDRIENTTGGLTRLTEIYLCKLLIPPHWISDVSVNANETIEFSRSKSEDEYYSLFTYYRYLINLYLKESKGLDANINDLDKLIKEEYKGNIENIKKGVYKTIFFLQNFVIFLTFRSNGTPKKLVTLIESYLVYFSSEQRNTLDIHSNTVIQSSERKDGVFLRFSHNQQYEVGLTTNIYRPYILIHSRYLKTLGDKLLYSTAFIFDYLLKYHPHAFSWRNLELLPEIILVNKDPNLRYFLTDILNFLSNMHIRETTTGLFQYKFYSKQSNEIKLLTKISESASAAFNFTLDESLHIIRYFRRKLDNLKDSHPNHHDEYVHSIGFLQGVLGDLYYFDKEYDEAIVYYADSVQVLRQYAHQNPRKMTKHQCVLYVYHSLLTGLCLEKIRAFDSAYAIYRSLILTMPNLLDVGGDENNSHSTTFDPKMHRFEDWDKPMRRMQLFLKPHIALLDLIEKQRVDGITYANLKRNHKEVYEFLVDTTIGNTTNGDVVIGEGLLRQKQNMDEARVSYLLADYFSNVGSLLFFKNKNYTDLHKLLYSFKLTIDETKELHRFLKILNQNEKINLFLPSLSSFTYYYLALKKLTDSYDSKLMQFSLFEDEFKKETNAIFKSIYLAYPKCTSIINNSSLFTIGNLLAKIGDALLSCLSKEMTRKYFLEKKILNIFDDDTFDETQTNDVEKILNQIKYQFDQYEYKFNISLKDKKNCFLLSFCDVNFVLLIYRLSGLFYQQSGRIYSYAFQYKKFLFVLKDYLNISTDSDLLRGFLLDEKETPSDTQVIENRKRVQDEISECCEKITVKIIKAHTSISEGSNRSQMLKYQEIFRFFAKPENNDERRSLYLSISTSAEIREAIVLTEEIKLKSSRLLGLSFKCNDKLNRTHLTPYDLVTNRFTRLHELRYQSEVNYHQLQTMGVDKILKSTILTDLQQLGLIDLIQESKFSDIVIDLISSQNPELINQRQFVPDPNRTNVFVDDFRNNALRENKFISKDSINKINNIASEIEFRLTSLMSQGVYISPENISDYFPDLFKIDPSQKFYKTIGEFEDLPSIICDSIFSLFEVSKTLNLFGVNYMSNYSFLANIHMKLANWCQIALTYDLIVLKYNQNQHIPHESMPTNTLRNLLRKTIGDDDMHHFEPNYHNELALKHYQAAIQTHNGGLSYRNINQSFSFLEDDFNDNLSHFSCASERFRINVGLVSKKIDDLKRKIKYSNIYIYNNYLDSWDEG